jgi:hypothetical protein
MENTGYFSKSRIRTLVSDACGAGTPRCRYGFSERRDREVKLPETHTDRDWELGIWTWEMQPPVKFADNSKA